MMNPDPALEWAATRTLTTFYLCLDESRFDDLVALFAPDGVWHRLGEALEGRAAIMAAMQERSKTLVTRHAMSNPLGVASAEGRMELASYLTVYAHDSGEAAPLPLSIESPRRFFVGRTRFVQDGSAWLIAEHRLTPVFEFAKARA